MTSREGIFAGGSFSGLRDISESVILADSASLGASQLIHSRVGGSELKVRKMRHIGMFPGNRPRLPSSFAPAGMHCLKILRCFNQG